jgi:hypothetical protein
LYHLLDQHYGSDLARLEGLREAGTLVGALSPQICPLCGAPPESQRHEEDCDGNIDAIIDAAEAECAKIHLLREELRESVDQLEEEAKGLWSNLGDEVGGVSSVMVQVTDERIRHGGGYRR